jgi:hypothetical protein
MLDYTMSYIRRGCREEERRRLLDSYLKIRKYIQKA